jgi:membrane protein implicated in regulation of membrane protease activity
MSMSDATLWWLLAGSVVVLELLTGTFYLLMVGLGMVAAALAAHSGIGMTWQLVLAAAVGASGVLAWYFIKKRTPADASVQSLNSVHLDIGETVQAEEWQADGTTRVKHRGAEWTAMLRPGDTPAIGTYRVVELHGNRLVVEKV